ncbi:MAG: hypothetical protein IJZ33_07890 [Clostridia bacterium]|nr:hypothetical protein [Clostridia bacterium]
MNELNDFLKRVQAHPAVYLGKKDLRALSFSLAGYEEALLDLTGRRVLFNTKFQRFVEQKYEEEYRNTSHWSAFLLKNRSEEDAFDLFFDLWAEFLRLYPHWEELGYDQIKAPLPPSA